MGLTQITTGGVDDNINIDSNTLKVDGTNNRVGIGTAAPSQQLDVVGSNAAVRVTESGGAELRVAAGGSTGFFGTYSNHPLQLLTNGTNAVRIDSSGKVGIATAAPQGKLHVKTSSSNGYPTAWGDGQLVVSTGETSTSLGIALSVNNSDNSGSLTCLSPNTSWRELNYRASIHKFFRTDTDESARIDSSGRLLVGTSSSSTADTLVLANNSSSTTDTAILRMRRSGTIASGSDVGLISFENADGLRIGASIKCENDQSANWATGDSPGRLVFSTSADSASSPTERLRISADGTAAFKGGTVFVEATSNTANTQLSLGRPDSTSAGYIRYINSENAMAFRTNGSGEDMRINSSGDVSINTTAPFGGTVANRQHLTLNGTNDVKFQWGTGGTERGYLYTGGNNLSLINTQNGYIRFNTNDTERIRLLAHGSLRVSTARTDSDYAQDNTNYWHVFHHHQNSQVAAIFEHSGNSNPGGLVIDFSDAAPNNNSSYYLKCQDSSTDTRLYIWSDGDVDNHDNSYSGMSDLKLKQDIVDAGSQWDDIKDLRVRKFRFKSDVAAYGDEAKTLIGVVAQETELVSPGLVKESPDRDRKGNDLGTTTKSVRYSVLYMKAVKALQEAMDRIETLEAKVAALETAE